MAHATMTKSPQMQECITNCLDCHAICVQTATHCLDMGGEHAGRKHQVTMLDCAQICATSADFMLRDSPMYATTCNACAEACRRCAEECERMARGDQMMQQCAEVCRRCAKSCEQMAHMQ